MIHLLLQNGFFNKIMRLKNFYMNIFKQSEEVDRYNIYYLNKRKKAKGLTIH